MDDKRLQEAVEHRLASDMLVDESQIEAEVCNGVVTLAGTVGSYAEKVVIQNTVLSVDGIHDIVNAVGIKPLAVMNPTDDELQEMVEQVLTWDALVPEETLVVSVRDGLVALTGTCQAAGQAGEAERAVSHLSGVRGVLNRIEVIEPELSTEDVRRAIADALVRRAQHQTSQIDVIVEGRTVTLIGSVQSSAERLAIAGAVGHNLGVVELRNELKVNRS